MFIYIYIYIYLYKCSLTSSLSMYLIGNVQLICKETYGSEQKVCCINMLIQDKYFKIPNSNSNYGILKIDRGAGNKERAIGLRQEQV